jgi:hypothetical protein
VGLLTRLISTQCDLGKEGLVKNKEQMDAYCAEKVRGGCVPPHIPD